MLEHSLCKGMAVSFMHDPGDIIFKDNSLSQNELLKNTDLLTQDLTQLSLLCKLKVQILRQYFISSLFS
jgi:hypothetical protein